MIRLVVFLLIVGAGALAVMWLADRPGEVSVTWQGYRIETSVLVLIVALAVLSLLAIAVWSAVIFVFRLPRRFSRARIRRKRRRGYQAISRGLVAIGSGDPTAARRFAADAARMAPHESLTLLLTAQTAQMAGDRMAAARAFETMSQRAETKLLGLRGLFIEAQRHDDATRARMIAEEASKTAPALPWAAHAALEFRCAEQDWEGALAQLSANIKSGLLDKNTFRRQRAVLLTARALALADTDRAAARRLGTEATKLAPDLVPAAALVGRLLAEAGESKQAGRILEAAWKASPHPDLADAYVDLRLSDTARDRLRRAQRLAQHHPGQIEGAIAVARAALDAREFALARATLEPFLRAPTQRIAMLMADLEQMEHGDDGRAREWIGRAVHAARDPAWTADGIVSERWMPVSPASGRLDAFEWRSPIAELAPRSIDAPEPAPNLIAASPSEPPKETTAVAPAAPAKAPAGEAVPSARKLTPVAAVIPLVHAPDDPGPEPDGDLARDRDTSHNSERWRRLKSLFQ